MHKLTHSNPSVSEADQSVGIVRDDNATGGIRMRQHFAIVRF
jgi:hypothetical protein